MNLSNIFSRLNKKQLEVVYSTNRRLLCLAGAGTGKTSTIISKILYQTEILKINPESILALTFTNAAGLEMQSRYLRYSQNDAIPYFGTFHGFCFKILSQNKNILNYLGYDSVPTVIDENYEKTLYSEVKLFTGVKLPAKKLAYSYYPKPSEKFEYELFQKVLNQKLKQKNIITFDILINSICKLFIENNDLAQPYLQQYKFIYVDEFQDTDVLQWNFIQAFMKYSDILLVGDVRQNIYSFRGCTNKILKSLLSDASWKVYILDQNYRSTIEICEYANKFLDNFNDDFHNIKLKSVTSGPDVKLLDNQDFIKCLSYADTKNVAIICRTNSEVMHIQNLLDNLNIEYETNQKLNSNILPRCAVDNDYFIHFLISQLPEIKQFDLLKKLHTEKNFNLIQFLKSKFLKYFEMIDKIKAYEEFETIKYLYDKGEISLLDVNLNQSNQSLYVGTIHSVKGLEFETVYVYGVNSNSFKIYSSEESMNLFYVACTRAKTQLYIIDQSLS